MSFPSGHASFSAYTMLYLVLYLQRRMKWSGSNLIRPTIQIKALMFTWYTGLSRITDYKHHWFDLHLAVKRKFIVNINDSDCLGVTC